MRNLIKPIIGLKQIPALRQDMKLYEKFFTGQFLVSDSAENELFNRVPHERFWRSNRIANAWEGRHSEHTIPRIERFYEEPYKTYLWRTGTLGFHAGLIKKVLRKDIFGASEDRMIEKDLRSVHTPVRRFYEEPYKTQLWNSTLCLL